MTKRAKLLEEKASYEKLLALYTYESKFGLYHPFSFDWFRHSYAGRSIELTEAAKKDIDSRLAMTKERLQEIYKCLGF